MNPVKAARKNKELSLKKLASKINVNYRTIANVEKGQCNSCPVSTPFGVKIR